VSSFNWSHRSAAAVGVVVSFVLLAIPTGVASAHKLKQQTCIQRFSTARMSGYSTVPMKLIGKPIKDSVTSPWEYTDDGAAQLTKIGTVCVYTNSGPDPADWPPGHDAVVGLGYNAKPSLWGKFAAIYRSDSGWFDGHEDYSSAYSPLKLGNGSKSFLLTFDQWVRYGYSATDDPGGFPEFYYAVIVLSKHHNLLMFSCLGLSAAQTESVASGMLNSGF
jgi:hypothetical protein